MITANDLELGNAFIRERESFGASKFAFMPSGLQISAHNCAKYALLSSRGPQAKIAMPAYCISECRQ